MSIDWESFCFASPITILAVEDLFVKIGVAGWRCESFSEILRIRSLQWKLMKILSSYASIARDSEFYIKPNLIWTGLFGVRTVFLPPGGSQGTIKNITNTDSSLGI